MSTKPPYRRHAREFKLRVCDEIRSGAIGRREAQRKYDLSDNLIQAWLAQHAAGTLHAAVPDEPDSRDPHAGCRARIAALEQKVGQLTMELEQRHGANDASSTTPRTAS